MADPIDDWINQILSEGQPPQGGNPSDEENRRKIAALQGELFGDEPTQPVEPEPPPGVPPWLWQEYQDALKDYQQAMLALQSAGYSNQASATARAANARARLTSTLGQIDNYMPKQPAAPTWSAGNTSSPYLTRQKPDGSLEQIPNPNYKEPPGLQKATQTPAELEYDQLRNQELRMKLAGERTPWERAQDEYKRQREEEQDKYKREQDEISRHRLQQSDEITRRNYAWQAANDLMQRRLQAAPMALIPGQQYFLGTEPGGVMQDIYKRSNLKYDPERFRVPVIPFDEEDPWQRATRMFGR